MNQDFDPLERIVEQELGKLSSLKAPPSLARNVMAKVRAGPAPGWWRQSIWSWPPLARAAFLLLAFALLLAACGGSWVAGSDVNSSWEAGTQKLGAFSALGTALLVLAGGLINLWQQAIQPWVPYFLMLGAAMYLLCVGVGTVFVRYTVRQT